MISDWKNQFTIENLELGRYYYRHGKVKLVEYDGNNFIAVVDDSKTYLVKGDLQSNRIYTTCNCLRSKFGVKCKHMSAALFAVEAQERGGDWKETLDTLPMSILKRLLTQAAYENMELCKRICSCKDIIENDIMAIHRNQIKNLRMQYDNHIVYVSGECIKKLNTYVQMQVQKHIQEGDREIAVWLVSQLYKEIFLSGRFIREQDVVLCVQTCYQALEQILQEASSIETDMVYEYILPLLEIPKRNQIDIGLENAIRGLPWTTDVLTRHLTWLDEHMNEDRLKYRIAIMQGLGQTPSDVITYLESRTESYAKEELQKWYVEYDISKAISTLQDARTHAESEWDVQRYTVRLIGLYKKFGDVDSEREELLFAVLELHMERYMSRLKELLEPGSWRDVFVQIVKEKPCESEWYKMLANEKMYDILLMEIFETEDLEMFLNYETVLSKHYPEQTCDILIRLLKKQMSMICNREEYKQVIVKLYRIKKYPNGKERLQELVNGFYVQYSNRRAMKEELTRAGYINNGEV